MYRKPITASLGWCVCVAVLLLSESSCAEEEDLGLDRARQEGTQQRLRALRSRLQQQLAKTELVSAEARHYRNELADGKARPMNAALRQSLGICSAQAKREAVEWVQTNANWTEWNGDLSKLNAAIKTLKSCSTKSPQDKEFIAKGELVVAKLQRNEDVVAEKIPVLEKFCATKACSDDTVDALSKMKDWKRQQVENGKYGREIMQLKQSFSRYSDNTYLHLNRVKDWFRMNNLCTRDDDLQRLCADVDLDDYAKRGMYGKCKTLWNTCNKKPRQSQFKCVMHPDYRNDGLDECRTR